MNQARQIIYASCLLVLSHTLQAGEGRWFNDAQVAHGQAIFEANCLSCHGENAASVANWKETDSEGKYPPPPLNGTGHAWHHPLKQLKKSITDGSLQLGGSMPAFKSVLDADEVDAVIAYFQAQWSEEIYRGWADRFKVADLVVPAAMVPAVPAEDVTRLLKLRLGTDNVQAVRETPVKGVFETRFGDKFAYLIDGGRYVFIGDMVDLQNAQNLTEISRRDLVVDELSGFPSTDLVVFPANKTELAVLNVFTDTSCGYCQKLHGEINHLRDAGITVRYFPFPRGGARGPGYATLKQVWCAPDKLQAMDIAKGVSSGDLPAGTCQAADAIDRGYALGNRIGITGTPALFTTSGVKFNGYVPYEQLIPRLLDGS